MEGKVREFSSSRDEMLEDRALDGFLLVNAAWNTLECLRMLLVSESRLSGPLGLRGGGPQGRTLMVSRGSEADVFGALYSV